MTKYVNILGGVGIDSKILSKYIQPLVLALFFKMCSEFSRKLPSNFKYLLSKMG